MSAPDVNAPLCRNCRKPLREIRVGLWGKPEGPHRALSEPRACEGNFVEVSGVTGSYECTLCGTRLLGVRTGAQGTGKFGYGGDGLFCTLRCGYTYAVGVCRQWTRTA